MFLLLELRFLFHHAGQIELFAGLPAGLCFGPELRDNVVGQVLPHGQLVGLFAHVHGPEAPVAGGILKEVGCIRAAEEHTAAGQLFDVAAIRGAVAVSTEGQKLLDAGNVRAPEGVKLRYLHQPHTLQKLRGVLPFKGPDTVVEPSLAHLIQQGTLAYALRAGEYQHIVKLAAGDHCAGDCCGKGLAAHSAVVGGVLRAQIVNEELIQTGHTVPHKAADEVLHLIEGVFGGVNIKGAVNVPA